MDAKRRIVIFSVGASLCIALAMYGAVRLAKIMLSRHGQSVALIMTSSENNPSLPQSKILCQPHVDFISTNKVSAIVDVDCMICIQNDSELSYVIASPYSLTGYDSLEFDVLLNNGARATMKRRRPRYLSDKGERIVIPPHGKWEYLISLDSRLWEFASGGFTNKISKIRPRFAYGAFMIDNKYYRTLEEAENREKKKRDWNDRDGELVGDWINYWK